jgi:tetratricopeptide (TPR) repeat protein/AAA+ ATPase superfamily predicted ATPase
MPANDSQIEQALKLLEKSPDSTSVHTQVGNIYLENGQHARAREHFMRAIQLDSKNVQAFMGLGRAEKDRNRTLQYLIEAVTIDPNNAEANLLLGRTYRKFKDNKRAIMFLRKALEIAPQNAEGWINLGICYNYRDKFDEAIRCMNRAIEIDPKSYHAYSNLSRYWRIRREYSKAIEYGKKSIEINPNYAAAYFNLYFANFFLGNFTDAIENLKKKISLDPKDVQAHYQLGDAYIAIGDYKNAQASFQKATAIRPAFEPAHQGLAGLYMDMGQPAEALKEFRQVQYRGIPEDLTENEYALRVGKINLANRKYLHIRSLQSMASYFESTGLPEGIEYASILKSLYKVLIDRLPPDVSQLKDHQVKNVITTLYELLSTEKEGFKKGDFAVRRDMYLRLKNSVHGRHFRNDVMKMLSNRWEDVERHMEEFLPIYPRIEITLVKAENIIYHESGLIRLAVINKGYLPAQNVKVKVQQSNEFGVKNRLIEFLSVRDILEFDLDVHIYTQGLFSMTLECDFDRGEKFFQTFKFDAFRKNPFFYGRPVKDPEMFFGREALLDSILSRIRNVAKQDILIHGIRRIGKTSLLYQINNRLRLPLIPLYFSLQQIGNVDDASLLRQLIFELCDAIASIDSTVADELKRKNMPGNMKELVDSLSFDMVSRAFRKDLEALLAFTKKLSPGLRIIILLDEGDLLFRLGVHIQRFMRDLLQRYDQVVMIMAGSPRIIELSAGAYDSPFYNNFAHENLTGLDFLDAHKLIQIPMEALGISCSMDIATRIYDYCGGISFYIQAVCFHLLNEVYARKKIQCSSDELNVAEEEVFAELRRSFEAIWHEFNEEQKTLLLYLSQQDHPVLRTEASIRRWNHLLQDLQEYSIISLQDGYVSIKAGLIRRWIHEIYKYV